MEEEIKSCLAELNTLLTVVIIPEEEDDHFCDLHLYLKECLFEETSVEFNRRYEQDLTVIVNTYIPVSVMTQRSIDYLTQQLKDLKC